MSNAAGIITCNTRPEQFRGMLSRRSIATLPFGGRYRLMDFVLSSMVNAGIRTVGIVAPYHYNSLLDHLGAGKDWFLDRKGDGLFLLPGVGRGLRKDRAFLTLQDLCENRGFVQRFRGDCYVIATADKVINLDVEEVLDFHEREGAQLTMVYRAEPFNEDPFETHQLTLSAPNGAVTGLFREHTNQGDGYFIGVMVINRTVLEQILDGYENSGQMDILDVVAQNLDSLQVRGFCFGGYLRAVESVHSYLQANMDLLLPQVRAELFWGEKKTLTKVKDCPPTRYGPRAQVTNCMVSSGCMIEGWVENSIIARDVRIGKGAIVKNCVIMQQSRIGEGARLENVILDKQVQVSPQVLLQGNEQDPIVINKNTVV